MEPTVAETDWTLATYPFSSALSAVTYLRTAAFVLITSRGMSKSNDLQTVSRACVIVKLKTIDVPGVDQITVQTVDQVAVHRDIQAEVCKHKCHRHHPQSRQHAAHVISSILVRGQSGRSDF